VVSGVPSVVVSGVPYVVVSGVPYVVVSGVPYVVVRVVTHTAYLHEEGFLQPWQCDVESVMPFNLIRVRPVPLRPNDRNHNRSATDGRHRIGESAVSSALCAVVAPSRVLHAVSSDFGDGG
jgi:hypothetical protein